MKKIILTFAVLLCMCVGAIAQTRVTFNGSMNLDWKFKRSFMQGTTLVVDFVVENNTSRDMACQITTSASTHIGELELKAFDDEGNVYTSSGWDPSRNKFSGRIGSKNSLFDSEIIPQGNLVKVRIQIAGIDEFSTLIKTLTVPVRSWENGGIHVDYAELRVTNIPIPRE